MTYTSFIPENEVEGPTIIIEGGAGGGGGGGGAPIEQLRAISSQWGLKLFFAKMNIYFLGTF